jgi:hypothetical protein
MLFLDIEQDDQWMELRAGKVGASSLHSIMANYGKAFGDGAKKLAIKLAVEQITGKKITSDYKNPDMERGHVDEPIASDLYSVVNSFIKVDNGGFFFGNRIGVSPDRLIGDDGIIEIKSAISTIHYERVRKGKLDSAHKWQCVFLLMMTKRKWLDFVSYCSEFPEGSQLFIYRIYAKDLRADMIKIFRRLNQFFKLVEKTKQKILNSKYRYL